MKLKNCAATIAAACMLTALSAPLAACTVEEEPPCEHKTITRVAQQDANCVNQGHFAHYECKDCGALFSDAFGKTEATAEDFVIETLPHSTKLQEETVGKYKNFYYCSTCGGYFEDRLGDKPIEYSELTDSSVEPVKLNDLSNYGNLLVTKSVNAESEFEDITGDFTLRMFVGWTNSQGKTYADLSSTDKLQTNYNLNRIGTLSNPVTDDWYNFGVGYSSAGLNYKGLQTPSTRTASKEFTELFLEKGGIFVRIVRKGVTVSFYFEDKFGRPRLMDSNSQFGGSGNLVRLAANRQEGVDGWLPFVKQAAICLGVANPRCVF